MGIESLKSSLQAKRSGLFLVSYEIGNAGLMGAPILRATFTVYTPEDTLSGGGCVTQAVSPPLHLNTKFSGEYSYLTVMPKESHILVTATGYPVGDLSPTPFPSGPGPVLLPNVKLRMILKDNWKSGTANFKYLVNGSWNEVSDVPVKQVETSQIETKQAA